MGQPARNRPLAAAKRVLLDDGPIVAIDGGASRAPVKGYIKGWDDNAIQPQPGRDPLNAHRRHGADMLFLPRRAPPSGFYDLKE